MGAARQLRGVVYDYQVAQHSSLPYCVRGFHSAREVSDV